MSAKKKKDETLVDPPVFSSAREFQSLSAADKEKVWNYYNRKIPISETRALTADERSRFESIQRRSAGRPKIGQGAKVVAVTLEKGLLHRVDDFAKRHRMKRAEMISKGLRMVMGEGE